MKRLLHTALSVSIALVLMVTISCADPGQPLIAISCGHPDRASMVSMNYSESVIRVGGLPMLVPVTADSLTLVRLLSRADGLILSGGGDLDPTYYGEAPVPECGEPDSLRDVYDMRLIRIAERLALPTLGICRGEQLLNVARGGTLYQDLPTQLADTSVCHNQVEPSSVATHTVRVLPGSMLHRATGRDSLRTNTHHHQAVRRLGRGLRATAWTADSLVEAFEATDGSPVWAVQFHPEALTAAGDTVMEQIIRAFISETMR